MTINFEKILANIKSTTPLIQNITNYITVNDCANIVLACGASPIMSDDVKEAAEINSICSALNINMGTLGLATEAMFAAGKNGNKIGKPVIFDPVGVGASAYRTEIAYKLLEEINFSVIRGNASEIKTISRGTGTTKGVDVDISDVITDENLDEAVSMVKALAKKYNTVIVITGEIDIVSDENTAYVIKNGHEMMTTVTGTGCMLSALTASFVAPNTDDVLSATVAAVCSMGLAGEIAYTRMSKLDGNSTYRNYLIDAIYNMTGKMLDEGAKYDIR